MSNDDTPMPGSFEEAENMRKEYMDDDTPVTGDAINLENAREIFGSPGDTGDAEMDRAFKLDTVSDPNPVSKKNIILPDGYVVDDGIAVLKEKIGQGGMGKVYMASSQPFMFVRNRILRGETQPDVLNDMFRDVSGNVVETNLDSIKQGVITDEHERRMIQDAANKKVLKRTSQIATYIRKMEKSLADDRLPYREGDTSKIDIMDTKRKERDKMMIGMLEKDFRSNDGIVAVKFLDPEFAERQNMRERFDHEARAARKLRHPNLVRAIERGYDNDSDMYYMIMEYVPNVMVLEETTTPLDPKAATKILIGALRGLKYIHDHGMYHRDVKPSNILVDEKTLFMEIEKESEGDETEFDILENPDVRLTDLGLAKDTDEEGGSLTKSMDKKTVMGTPYYMSPESLDGVSFMNEQSDIYSFAGTAFKLLTGERPYEGSIGEVMRQIRAGMPVRISSTEGGKDVHPKLAELFDRCFMKLPIHRLTSSELLDGLEEIDRSGMYYAPSTEERDAQESVLRERKRTIRKSIKMKERITYLKSRMKVFDHTKESTALVELYDDMLSIVPRTRETVIRRLGMIEASIRHCKYLNKKTKLERMTKDFSWEEENRKILGVDDERREKKMPWLLKVAVAASAVIPTGVLAYSGAKGYMEDQANLDLLLNARETLEVAVNEKDIGTARGKLKMARKKYDGIPVKDYDIRFEIELDDADKLLNDREKAEKATRLLNEIDTHISENNWREAKKKYEKAWAILAYLDGTYPDDSDKDMRLRVLELETAKGERWERLKKRDDDLVMLGTAERAFPELETEYRSLMEKISEGNFPSDGDIKSLLDRVKKQNKSKLKNRTIINPDNLGLDGTAAWKAIIGRYDPLQEDVEDLPRERALGQYLVVLKMQSEAKEAIGTFGTAFTFDLEESTEKKVEAIRTMLAGIDMNHIGETEKKKGVIDPGALGLDIESGKRDFAARLYSETEAIIGGASFEKSSNETAKDINMRLGRIKKIVASIDRDILKDGLLPDGAVLRKMAGKMLQKNATEHYGLVESLIPGLEKDYDKTVSAVRGKLSAIAGYLEAMSTIGYGTGKPSEDIIRLRRAFAEGQKSVVLGMYSSTIQELDDIIGNPVPESRKKEMEAIKKRSETIKKRRKGINSANADLMGIDIGALDKRQEEADKAVTGYRSLVKLVGDPDQKKSFGAREELAYFYCVRKNMGKALEFVPGGGGTPMFDTLLEYKKIMERANDKSRYVRTLPDGTEIPLTDKDVETLRAGIKKYASGELDYEGLSDLLNSSNSRGAGSGEAIGYISKLVDMEARMETSNMGEKTSITAGIMQTKTVLDELLEDTLLNAEDILKQYPLGKRATDAEALQGTLKRVSELIKNYRTG